MTVYVEKNSTDFKQAIFMNISFTNRQKSFLFQTLLILSQSSASTLTVTSSLVYTI